MKRLFSFCVLLFLGIPFIQSQNYHPLLDRGKHWSTHHVYSPTSTAYSDYTEFEDDTLIGPYTYKHAWKYTDEAMTQKYLEGFIREDVIQRKVFFRFTDVSADFLLYDFNASAGDTLLLHLNPYASVLDSIGTFTLLSGEQRRSFFLHSTFPFPCAETWVEGIGSITKGVLNSGTCGFVGDDPQMLCAWENDTLKYHNPGFTYCFVITGKGDLPPRETVVKVFPNPTSAGIHVEILNSVKNVQFQITDLTGRTIYSCDLVSIISRIDLNKHTFPHGIYLYRASSGDETIAVGKLTIL